MLHIYIYKERERERKRVILVKYYMLFVVDLLFIYEGSRYVKVVRRL